MISIEELARMIPVRPPTVKRNTNPIAQRRAGVKVKALP
jgi:hypothetical protein